MKLPTPKELFVIALIFFYFIGAPIAVFGFGWSWLWLAPNVALVIVLAIYFARV